MRMLRRSLMRFLRPKPRPARLRGRIAVLAGMMLSAGCGFQPLYAVPGGGAPGLRDAALAGVEAPEDIAPVVERAFQRRTASKAGDAAYDLSIRASEQAERLAVQIDASVTRYNYRLVGEYTLTERNGGKRYTGRVASIASFNVVDSQYSTLYAEAAAREKAAVQLAEDVERDILLKLAAEAEKPVAAGK